VIPSVGRMVHYTSYGTPKGEYDSVCRAAVITEVEAAEVVGLCVLNPTGQFFNQHVPHDETETDHGRGPGGTWHWPERVEDA
jgi:hypothetical protein